MKTRKILSAVVVGLSLTGLSLVAGCSGGSGGGSTTGVTNNVVTRGNENNYSLDALILAARESTNAWISADIAGRRDTDLATIRQQYTQLGDIRPRPGGNMRQMLVRLPTSAPWFEAWKSGTLTTGVPELDSLLTEFKATKVAKVVDLPDYTAFLLTFEHPLQIARLAERFKAASSVILNAEINGLVGDGDNIVFSTQGETRQYVFSKGWGDCPAGCTSRHFWTVRITGTNLSLEESGPALPATQ